MNNKDLRQRLKALRQARKESGPSTPLSTTSTVVRPIPTTTMLKKGEQRTSSSVGSPPQGHPSQDSQASPSFEDLWAVDSSGTEPRVIGEKSTRQEDPISRMIMVLEHRDREDRARRLEDERKLKDRDAEVKELRTLVFSLLSKQRSEDDAQSSHSTLMGESGFTSVFKRDRAEMEASKGDFLAEGLEGAGLPDHWPTYQWPKSWGGKVKLRNALIALKDLQEHHMAIVTAKMEEFGQIDELENDEDARKKLMRKALKSALTELQAYLRANHKGLRPYEWEIIKPIVYDHKGDYALEHTVWEICLKANKEHSPWMNEHLQVCRTVPPSSVVSSKEWVDATNGGEWPSTCTKGFRTGRHKVEFRGFFKGEGSKPGSKAAINLSSHPTSSTTTTTNNAWKSSN